MKNQKNSKKDTEDESTILDGILDDLPNEVRDIDTELIPKKIRESLDYDQIIIESELNSKEMVKQNVLFYFTQSEIKAEPYITEKMKIDTITISNLLFQLKIGEHAIIKIMEAIDDNIASGMIVQYFNALARLQSSKIDMVKQLQNAITTMETTYRSLRTIYKDKELDGRLSLGSKKRRRTGTKLINSINTDNNTVRITGGRELAKSLRQLAESD